MNGLMPKVCPIEWSQIDSNVFLSSYELTTESKLLNELNIKRIVTLDVTPIDTKMTDVKYLFIRAMDNTKEDLLSKFEECHQFISEGVSKGDNVLVHCAAGVSRSATIVISYIMVKNSMSFEEALDFVTKKRSIIDPNDGFRRQLKIFERMNRKLDPLNSEYRQFLVEHLKYKIMICRPWSGSTYRTSCPPLDTYFQKLRDLNDDNNGHHRREDTYKCKKCRFYLFNEINVIKNSENQTVCQFIYTEPLQWMTQHISQQEKGALNCPNCMSPLGHFDWYSIKCHFDCQRHKSLDCLIFQINSNKVDSPHFQTFSTNL